MPEDASQDDDAVDSLPPSEKGRVTPEFETAVREACEAITDDPVRGDVVRLDELLDHPQTATFGDDLTEDGFRSRLGRVLDHSEYATKIARGKYRITL